MSCSHVTNDSAFVQVAPVQRLSIWATSWLKKRGSLMFFYCRSNITVYLLVSSFAVCTIKSSYSNSPCGSPFCRTCQNISTVLVQNAFILLHFLECWIDGLNSQTWMWPISHQHRLECVFRMCRWNKSFGLPSVPIKRYLCRCHPPSFRSHE